MGVTLADLPPVTANPTGQTVDQNNTLSVDLTEILRGAGNGNHS